MVTALTAGMSASLFKKFTLHDNELFTELSFDKNPLHFSEEMASKSIFKRRIVPGMLVASLLSGVLGTVLPGPGTIYLEQNLRFLAPVFIGDTCQAVVTVGDVLNQQKGIYKMDTYIINQSGQCVIEGYAVIKYQ